MGLQLVLVSSPRLASPRLAWPRVLATSPSRHLNLPPCFLSSQSMNYEHMKAASAAFSLSFKQRSLLNAELKVLKQVVSIRNQVLLTLILLQMKTIFGQ